MTISSQLIGRLAAIEYASLPGEIVEATKLRILDGLGVVLLGSRTRIAAVAEGYVDAARGGRSQADGIETYPKKARRDVEAAAFILGTYGFSQNYADTSLLAVSHHGSVVTPALLLGSQARPVSGRAAISAVVRGYELMEYIGRVLNNGKPRMGHQLKGFRPTATAGPFGAVATVGSLWDVDLTTQESALQIACSYVSGLRRHGGTDAATIRVQSGEALRHGVTALLLAQSGLQGESLAFEGSGGFFDAYKADDIDHLALSDYETTFSIDQMATKLHCTAHTLPSALDALLDLRAAHGFDLRTIAAIEIRIPEAHAEVASIRKPVPADLGQLGGSYEFCAGIVLKTGDYVWPLKAVEHVSDPDVQWLASRVKVVSDVSLSAAFESDHLVWPARVTIRTEAGQQYVQERRQPRGVGMTAESKELIRRKFDLLATEVLGKAAARRIAEFVSDVEGSADFYADLRAASGV